MGSKNIRIEGIDYTDPKNKVIWLKVKTDDGWEKFTAYQTSERTRKLEQTVNE